MAAKSGLEESVRVKVHQPPVPAESVSVRVFGDVVVLHGERVVPVVPRMLRSLLGVLVVHANRVVSADRLIDDLWQDDPPSAPAASLQAYVSNLRKLLEPDRPARTPPSALVTKDPGYSLRLDPACLDLTEFEVLVKQGRDLVAVGDHSSGEEALGRAIAVCSGVPFAELAAEPWAQGTVVRVAELRAAAIEDRMAAWLELGRHNAAVGVLQAAVESDPWRERGWELLLVALYRSQRQADTLRAFRNAVGASTTTSDSTPALSCAASSKTSSTTPRRLPHQRPRRTCGCLKEHPDRSSLESARRSSGGTPRWSECANESLTWASAAAWLRCSAKPGSASRPSPSRSPPRLPEQA